MAKDDDKKQPDGDEQPHPWAAPVAAARSRRANQFSLSNLMIWTIVIALWTAAGRQISQEDNDTRRVIEWLIVGLATSVLGLWVALKGRRLVPLGWVLFIIGFSIVTIETTGPLAMPSIPLLIGLIISLSYRKRAENQDALLDVITLAAGSEMPLAPGVLALSSQISGMFQIWSETLAEMLGRGFSLVSAIDLLPRLFSRQAALMIQIGTECGHLEAGLREAVLARSTSRPASRQLENKLAYLAWVGLVWMFVFTFLMYFIMPKLEAIFKDFGIDFPEATKVVIKGSHLVVDYFWIPLLIILGSIVFATLFLDRLFPRRHTLLILRALALAFDAGMPISSSVGWLAHWYQNRWVRDRLELVEESINQGHDWIAALRSKGLVKASDAGVLASAQRVGNLAWAIRELIATSERRRNFRLAALLQLGFIAAIVALGFLVLLLTVAYFMPLTTVLMRLS